MRAWQFLLLVHGTGLSPSPAKQLPCQRTPVGGADTKTRIMTYLQTSVRRWQRGEAMKVVPPDSQRPFSGPGNHVPCIFPFKQLNPDNPVF